MKFNLDNLVKDYDNLQQELSNPDVFKDQKKVRDLSSRKKQLENTVELYKDYKQAQQFLDEAVEIL